MPIVESSLDDLAGQVIQAGRLTFTESNLEAVAQADYVFLCLPTPEGGDGRADLSFVLKVAEQIGPHLKPDAIVVNKSTVPVGTAFLVAQELNRNDVHVVSNPEFLAEGTAVHDFLNPDRVVVGSDSQVAAVKVAGLYERLSGKVIVTDAASSEMIKYASNAFLATKLSFVNSLAAVCEAAGADVRRVTAGMGADRRIGSEFLKPGPGWGGSCFPKDSKALAATAEDLGSRFELLESVIAINAEHKARMIANARNLLGGSVAGAAVAVWGLTFKAGTDDLRDSPAREIAGALAAEGARVTAYDPTVRADLPGIRAATSAVQACEGADLLILATEWPEFAAVDLNEVGAVMARRLLLDTRNVVSPFAADQAGFAYAGIGIATGKRRAAESVAS